MCSFQKDLSKVNGAILQGTSHPMKLMLLEINQENTICTFVAFIFIFWSEKSHDYFINLSIRKSFHPMGLSWPLCHAWKRDSRPTHSGQCWKQQQRIRADRAIKKWGQNVCSGPFARVRRESNPSFGGREWGIFDLHKCITVPVFSVLQRSGCSS